MVDTTTLKQEVIKSLVREYVKSDKYMPKTLQQIADIVYRKTGNGYVLPGFIPATHTNTWRFTARYNTMLLNNKQIQIDKINMAQATNCAVVYNRSIHTYYYIDKDTGPVSHEEYETRVRRRLYFRTHPY